MDDNLSQSNQPYKASSLWLKIAGTARLAGKNVVEKALQLHYAAQREETPAWARKTVYGAIAYFILPLDAIPDFVPLTGYTDDMAALAAALTAISLYIDASVKEKARQKAALWFDPENP